MKCKECGDELFADTDLNVTVAAHDDTLFEMILGCDECGARFNNFVSIDDFVKMEDD